MSISSVFSRPRGNLIPTGLPIEVADEAARLALTPVEGARYKQLDTGTVWSYLPNNGWFPAPLLWTDPAPEDVRQGVQFQALSSPTNVIDGTLAIGIPLEADNDALFPSSPTEGQRVTNLEAGVTYAFYSTYGWLPAPQLRVNLEPSDVVSGKTFQSIDYPDVTNGSLMIPTTIQPAQSFADHIQKFFSSNVTISDSLCTLIDETLVGTYFSNFDGNVNLIISAPLTTANVDAILATMDTYFVGMTGLTGTINLTGLCEPVTLSNNHWITSCALFPTPFFVWESGAYGGYHQYTGIDPTSMRSVTFRYEGIYPRWDIYDNDAAATIGFGTIASTGDPVDAATYYDIMATLQGGIVSAVSAGNLNRHMLEQRGLTVYTN